MKSMIHSLVLFILCDVFSHQLQAAAPVIHREDTTVYIIVDQQPVFPGEINQWTADNIKYPLEAIRKGIQGKVYADFIVEKDGSTSHFSIIRGVSPSLDQEVLRLLGTMPKWKPGKNKGKAVRVKWTLPVSFKLDNSLPSLHATNQTDTNTCITYIEEMPKFPEGNIQKWISEQMPKGEGHGIEGKVYVQFVIEADGSLSNIIIIKGLDHILDQEALRIINSMPKWIPAKERGKPVRLTYTLPIHFRPF